MNHRYDEINALDELVSLTHDETEKSENYLCAQKCLEFCQAARQAHRLLLEEDAFYDTTLDDSTVYYTFHTYLNLGMSEEATDLYETVCD